MKYLLNIIHIMYELKEAVHAHNTDENGAYTNTALPSMFQN